MKKALNRLLNMVVVLMVLLIGGVLYLDLAKVPEVKSSSPHDFKMKVGLKNMSDMECEFEHKVVITKCSSSK